VWKCRTAAPVGEKGREAEADDRRSRKKARGKVRTLVPRRQEQGREGDGVRHDEETNLT